MLNFFLMEMHLLQSVTPMNSLIGGKYREMEEVRVSQLICSLLEKLWEEDQRNTWAQGDGEWVTS